MISFYKVGTEGPHEGYALPGVLVVSTMISFLILLLTGLHRDVINLAKDTKEILRERNRPIDFSDGPQENSGCFPMTAPPITRLLCKTAPRVFKSYPKIALTHQRRYLDFTSIFSRTSTCSHTTLSNSSIQGRLPTSPRTCHVGAFGAERIILRESLRAQRITLLSNTDGSAALLASLGDIQIESELILVTDAVVLAAGSVHIKKVSSSDGSPRRVTLIAHSGDISIQNIGATVFPLLFGRSTFTTPSVPFNPPYPMVIEKRQSFISGIMLFSRGI